MSVKKTLVAFAAVLTVSGGLGVANTANAAGGGAPGGYHPPHIDRQSWSFGGLFGRYDKEQLKRGFTLYNEVCSGCHSMNLLSYRNLMEKGGPGYTKEEVEEIIADKEVPAGPNDEGETRDEDGELLMRPALLTDRFIAPYQNDKAAMAANGGSLPPDLSVMAKARGIPHFDDGSRSGNPVTALIGGFGEYFGWVFGTVKDIATQYGEAGPDYIYALMMNYKDEAPKGIDVGDKSFNAVFPGFAISMPPQFSWDDEDEKKEADKNARDVAAFLMWAAEPHLEARKSLGVKVLIYLLILSVLMYFVKRTLWSGIKH